MKVLSTIIVPPHLSVSGGARAAEHLAEALASHCEMSVASMMAEGSGGDTVTRLPVRVSLPALAPWSRIPERHRTPFYRSDIPDLIRRGRYDLVHIHNPMPALEMERVARACIGSGIPYVVSTHGFNEIANGISVYRFGVARAFLWKHIIVAPVARVVRKAAAVFALSPADFDVIRGFGYRGNRLITVGNGTPSPVPADREEDAAICLDLGLPDRANGQITCMFLGNHTPNKGLPVLLEAFSSLRIPFLLIVGGARRSGVDYDRYVRSCGPGQQIAVTGRLSDRQVAALYRRSDLFVFPTLADTFPLVVLEAMAHGLPVLASRVGGIPHQIDAASGVLVPPGNPTALASAVEELAAIPDGLAAMGRHAKARATKEFTWASAAARAYEGYTQVLEGRDMPVVTRAHWTGGRAQLATNEKGS